MRIKTCFSVLLRSAKQKQKKTFSKSQKGRQLCAGNVSKIEVSIWGSQSCLPSNNFKLKSFNDKFRNHKTDHGRVLFVSTSWLLNASILEFSALRKSFEHSRDAFYLDSFICLFFVLDQKFCILISTNQSRHELEKWDTKQKLYLCCRAVAHPSHSVISQSH